MSLQTPGRQFDDWAHNHLFQADHRKATLILDKAVDIYLIELFRQLGLYQQLSNYTSAETLSSELHFESSAAIALQPMLLRLADRYDFLNYRETDNSYLFKSIREPGAQMHRLPELTRELASLGKNYSATMEFLEFGFTHFKRSLHDDHEFMDRVLTGQEKAYAETWHRATNTDPLQDIHGILGAKAMQLLFEQGNILEIGGGTGNGLRNNLDMLTNTGQIEHLEQYLFTDVSMPFIVNTKRALHKNYPPHICKWQLLNINKNWQKQRISNQSTHLIYGVNAAHIAQDIVAFLKQCASTLKPGGHLVFSERIRQTPTEMAPREIVLNQSLYHRTAAIRNQICRPAHAYLTRRNWLKACELSGFSNFEVWPSEKSLNTYFPEQYAAVIVAQR